ncbi:MAG: AtpZ/AtpI family protein, partial [Cyclobacteriaceae bacterium]
RKNKKSHSSKPERKENQVLKFSGLAFELFAIIAVGSYIGYRIDLYFATKVPYWLLSFVLVSTAVAIYSVYRRLPKD